MAVKVPGVNSFNGVSAGDAAVSASANAARNVAPTTLASIVSGVRTGVKDLQNIQQLSLNNQRIASNDLAIQGQKIEQQQAQLAQELIRQQQEKDTRFMNIITNGTPDMQLRALLDNEFADSRNRNKERKSLIEQVARVRMQQDPSSKDILAPVYDRENFQREQEQEFKIAEEQNKQANRIALENTRSQNTQTEIGQRNAGNLQVANTNAASREKVADVRTSTKATGSGSNANKQDLNNEKEKSAFQQMSSLIKKNGSIKLPDGTEIKTLKDAKAAIVSRRK